MGWHSLAVSVALGVCSATPGAPFKDDAPSDLDDRFALTSRTRMPVRLVERPLTLSRHTYGMIFDLEVTQVSAGVPLARFTGGAGYGINEDLEVGIILLNVSFSKAQDSGLHVPNLFVKQRLVSGVVELAIVGAADLPLSSPFRLSLGLPLRIHLGRFARIDVAARAFADIGTGFLPEVHAPIGVAVQITENLALEVRGDIGLTDFQRLRVLGHLSARVGWTFADRSGAFADIGLEGRTPDRSFRAGRPADPRIGNHWMAVISTRWFIPDHGDRGWGDFDFR